MPTPEWLSVREEVRHALETNSPVVALESTLISHGLPWPTNVETALESEKVIRERGATPATIAVLDGVPTVGLSREEIESLATQPGVLKASRRDLAAAVFRKRTAATTVAATMHLAHRSGIRVFATGGIGGAHRDTGELFDISADLTELSRTPVLVVCAGAKSILHLPRTLEILETLSVPVVGYRTSDFPAFYVRASGLPVPTQVDSPEEAARLFAIHEQVGGTGMLLVQPIDASIAIDSTAFSEALEVAERDARREAIRGPAVTPFLLKRLAELTGGKTLVANRELIVNNARLAAEVAFSEKDEG